MECSLGAGAGGKAANKTAHMDMRIPAVLLTLHLYSVLMVLRARQRRLF
jgi:hypothetical protein